MDKHPLRHRTGSHNKDIGPKYLVELRLPEGEGGDSSVTMVEGDLVSSGGGCGMIAYT